MICTKYYKRQKFFAKIHIFFFPTIFYKLFSISLQKNPTCHHQKLTTDHRLLATKSTLDLP